MNKREPYRAVRVTAPTLRLEIFKDYVLVEAQHVERLGHLSPAQWMAAWEHMLDEERV